MFTKRKEKKEAAAQQLRQERQNALQEIKDAVAAADRMEDPAARALELHGMQSVISEALEEQRLDIYERSEKSEKAAAAGTGVGIAAVAGALAPVTGGASLGFAVFSMMAGVSIAGTMRRKQVQKKLEEETGDHVEALQAEQKHINELIKADIESNLGEIPKSPLYEKFMACSSLAREFGAAAARFIEAQALAPVPEEEPATSAAEADASAQAPTPATDSASAVEPAKKEKADFSRLADLGRGAPKKPQGPKA